MSDVLQNYSWLFYMFAGGGGLNIFCPCVKCGGDWASKRSIVQMVSAPKFEFPTLKQQTSEPYWQIIFKICKPGSYDKYCFDLLYIAVVTNFHVEATSICSLEKPVQILTFLCCKSSKMHTCSSCSVYFNFVRTLWSSSRSTSINLGTRQTCIQLTSTDCVNTMNNNFPHTAVYVKVGWVPKG